MVRERDSFIDTVPGPDDPVIDPRGDTPTDTTDRALIEETGGEAERFGGTLIGFGGSLSSSCRVGCP